MPPLAWVSAAVRTTGGGSALPVLMAKMFVVEASSVCDGLFGSDAGMNSCTVPVMQMLFPSAAVAGGADDVKTKMPSEVFGSPSPGEGIWIKKPFDFKPVTMPLVVSVLPASGDVLPLPCICAMVCVGAQVVSALMARENVSCAVFVPLSVTWIVKENGEPAVVLGMPVKVAP